MFSGEYEHIVDEKGRLTIPAKFRAGLAEGLFVTRGLDGCLFVFPPSAWRVLSEKVANLPLSQSSARLFSRMIYSGIECKLDRQGRILLSPALREHADIESEVVITGVNSRLEIWSKKRWQEQTIKMEEESGSMAEQLASTGI
jgi:MraZ protein